MKRKLLLVIGLLLALTIFLAACGSPATQPPTGNDNSAPTSVAPTQPAAVPTEPKILTVRLYGDIQNLDPAFQISENDTVVANAVMDALVRYCPNSYELCNQLAETITQSDDGLEIQFKLREGVMWQNGNGELTTEDVKYSYERMIDPDLNAAYADDWSTLDYVEIIDKYNGIIHLKEAFAPLWTSTLPANSGTIVSKAWVEKVGVDGFATDIIGTGPYIFADWKPQERVVLKKNPNYWGEAPYWDEIHLIPIEDDTSAEIALEAGDIDFTRIDIKSVERFESNAEFMVVTKPSLRYEWLAFNVQHPKLQDVNVRWAVIYGIDVPSILEAVYDGKVERECALIPPGLVGFWADAPCYDRDVAKAKEYLAAAGLDSLDLRLDLQDTTKYRSIAEIIQQNLKEVGINVELNPMDSSTYWSSTFGDESVKNNELMLSNFSMQPDPSWASMWFTCDQVAVWNAMAWCNQDFDALHAEAMVTTDLVDRANLYVEMQKIWDKDAIAVFTTHGSLNYAYTPDILPALTPNGMPQVQFFLPAK
jgi:peptide/nickel transport system substrate-binding protein